MSDQITNIIIQRHKTMSQGSKHSFQIRNKQITLIVISGNRNEIGVINNCNERVRDLLNYQ